MQMTWEPESSTVCLGCNVTTFAAVLRGRGGDDRRREDRDAEEGACLLHGAGA